MVFSKGDRVTRINGDDSDEKGMYKGSEYTVSSDNGNDICLEGISGTWCSNYFSLVYRQPNKSAFSIGDRVLKARWFGKNVYCRFGGDESSVPIGTEGTVTLVYENDISVSFDNGQDWKVNACELDKIGDTIIKQEDVKMKPAETKFEKAALQEAKKKQIEIETTRKAEDFKREIQNWIMNERYARDYRAKADELAKALNLTKEEMNDLL